MPIPDPKVDQILQAYKYTHLLAGALCDIGEQEVAIKHLIKIFDILEQRLLPKDLQPHDKD